MSKYRAFSGLSFSVFGPEKNPSLDTFQAVIVNKSLIIDQSLFPSKEFQILLMDQFFIRYLKNVIERAEMIIVNSPQITFINII